MRSFALYGDTTGETDEFGLPVRYPWAADYRGRAMVLYGHTPVPEPEWLNNTLCLDTGCVFGGRLTALRYPEKEFVSVPAERVWYEPAKPLSCLRTGQAPALTAQQDPDEVLDCTTMYWASGSSRPDVRARSRSARRTRPAALEVMSRFAIDPHWLIYLPPTMSPCATSAEPGLLEHPAEAFAAYAADGVAEVLCEEKHMGSRAMVLACRDDPPAGDAARRFGVAGDQPEWCTPAPGGRSSTRPGRRSCWTWCGPR